MSDQEASSSIGQYLTFELDKEVFALEISRAREVLEFSGVTKVPRTPDFMIGVLNLRGNVVPVIDLHRKFDLRDTEKTVDTCVIIVELSIDGEEVVVGALADSVREVIELEESQIEPPPRIGNRLDTDFIKGMGKQDDDFMIILDIERIFTIEELLTTKEFSKSASSEPSSVADSP